MHPYRDPPSPARRADAPEILDEPDDDELAWVLLAIGLIPVVGLLVASDWNPSEVALAILMTTWALQHLVRRHVVGPAIRLAHRRARRRLGSG